MKTGLHLNSSLWFWCITDVCDSIKLQVCSFIFLYFCHNYVGRVKRVVCYVCRTTTWSSGGLTSGPAECALLVPPWSLSNNCFNSESLWMQDPFPASWAFFQSVAGFPLFLYYHKQIRGSGEHTQMQIAAERAISTLHYNGPSCMCRASQPIKQKMNLM